MDREKVPRNGKGAQDRGKRPLLYSTLLYTLRAGKVEADLVRGWVDGWMDKSIPYDIYLKSYIVRQNAWIRKNST